MEVKVYIVQRESGEIVGAKLTHAAAHSVALANAPSRIVLLRADKVPISATQRPRGAEDGLGRTVARRDKDVRFPSRP